MGRWWVYNIMRIKEIYESLTDKLPKDGKGNVVIWDPQQRIEVLVPEKDVPGLVSRDQIVGGSLNMDEPSIYPPAKGTIYKAPRAVSKTPALEPNQKPSAIQSFKRGFTRGQQNIKSIKQNLPYTTAGKALSSINQWVKNHQK